MLREIRAEIVDQIPPDALALRAARFPSASGGLVEGDCFDERSLHIVFREGSTIAVYGRLTIGAPGVFRTWSRGAAQVPEGTDVADLGRCCVHSYYRRLELLRSVCVEALAYSFNRNLSHVNGTYIPGRFLAGSLHDMGFKTSGPCAESFEPNGNKTYQPVTCDLKDSACLWPAQQTLVSDFLAKQGFILNVLFRKQNPSMVVESEHAALHAVEPVPPNPVDIQGQPAEQSI
jgi:hypothetical protein